MTVFDLLFLALAAAAVGSLIAAGAAALRGRGSQAFRMLRRLGIAAVAYLVVVVIVALLQPRRVLAVGDPWCFDDWCLSVESVSRVPAQSQVAYTVSLRLFSRARRVSQRAKGAWVYLIDGRGHRYQPEPERDAVPLDVRLAPGEWVATSRVFRVPAGVEPLGLITGHGPAWLPALIIGDEASLFHKRTYVRLE